MVEEALSWLPHWAPKPITREAVVEAALSMRGLDYDETATFATFDEDGRVRGHATCYGLLFLVVIRLKLVDERTLWRAWHAGVAAVGLPLLLRAYLGREMDSIRIDGAAPGDALLYRWQGLSPVREDEEENVRRGKHHVAVVSEIGPPRGLCVVQATDTSPTSGGVYHGPVASHDQTQIIRAATFRQFTL